MLQSSVSCLALRPTERRGTACFAVLVIAFLASCGGPTEVAGGDGDVGPDTQGSDAQVADTSEINSLDMVADEISGQSDTAPTTDALADAIDTTDASSDGASPDVIPDAGPDTVDDTLDATSDVADDVPIGPTTCKSDKDCAAAGKVCDPLSLVCVACLSDAECAPSQHCVGLACQTYTACTNSLGCTNAKGPDGVGQPICDKTIGECSACLAAADCPASNDCLAKACVPYKTCQNSTECGATQVCDKVANRCVDCLGNADCQSNELCQAGTCTAFVACASDKQCTPLGLLCDTAKGKCAQCLTNTDCPDIYNCQKVGVDGTGQCIVDVCAQGQGNCAGNAKVTCNVVGDGYGSPQDCGISTTCVPAGGKPVCSAWVCTPGTNCDGDKVVTCSGDGLTVEKTEDCAAGAGKCVAGACKPIVCAAGQSVCDGNTVKTCALDGLSVAVSLPCAATEYCDGGACKAQVCTPNQPLCDGNLVRTCNASGSGFADAGSDCGAEKCSIGVCKPIVCAASSQFCDGQTVKTCAADGLSAVVAQSCTSSEYCDGGACKAQLCGPSQPVCIGDFLKVCNAVGSGTTSDAGQDCGAATGKCVAGACKPIICTASTNFCDGNTVKTCASDGLSAVVAQNCGASDFCDAAQCKPQVCAPNQMLCDSNFAKTCNANGSGYVDAGTDCGSGGVCATGVCVAKICTPASQFCDGSLLKNCAPDGLTVTKSVPCGVGNYCGPNKFGDAACLADVCDPSQPTCSGTTATTCAADGSGFVGGGVDCAKTGKVCSAGVCVSLLCDPKNPLYCNGLDAMKCDATGLSPSKLQTCGAGFYCGSGACSAQICTPDSAGVCAENKPAVCNADGSGYATIGADCGVGKACSAGACLTQVCGNGVVEVDEQCDAGSLNGGAVCSATCTCVNAGCVSSVDAAWSNVVLLMHMDGVQGSTTFIDEKGHVPSSVGTAIITQTPAPKYGTGSMELVKAGEYVTFPASDDWKLGTGDFTIESWIYPLATLPSGGPGGAYNAIVVSTWGTPNNWALNWDNTGTNTGNGEFWLNGGATLTFTKPNTLSQWIHLAAVRKSGQLGVFINGNLTVEGWQAAAANLSTASNLYVGVNSANPSWQHFPGHLDDLRITKGIARYTGNFTPSTAAFGAPGSGSVCTPNAASCLGNLAGTCNAAGTGLVSATTCGAGNSCSSGACLPQICTPNATYCDGNTVKLCDATGLAPTLVSTCSASEYCDAAQCKSQVCSPSASVCVANAPATCNAKGSGYSVLGSDCGTGKTCSAGVCFSQICTPNAPYCDGNVAKQCDATGLAPTTSATCSASQYCDAGACKAQVCTPNGQVCVANAPATCNANGSGYSALGSDCGAGKTCSGGACLTQVCGNGVVEGTESCDAGPQNGGTACQADCVCPPLGCNHSSLFCIAGTGAANPRLVACTSTPELAGSWTPVAVGATTGGGVMAGIAGVAGGKLWTYDTSGKLYSSPDGSTWTTAITQFSGTSRLSITRLNSTFVLAAVGTTTTSLYHSVDGLTFTNDKSVTGALDVAAGPGYVLTSDASQRSVDGMNWQANSQPPKVSGAYPGLNVAYNSATAQWGSLAWNNGSAGSGVFATSSDGTSWSTASAVGASAQTNWVSGLSVVGANWLSWGDNQGYNGQLRWGGSAATWSTKDSGIWRFPPPAYDSASQRGLIAHLQWGGPVPSNANDYTLWASVPTGAMTKFTMGGAPFSTAADATASPSSIVGSAVLPGTPAVCTPNAPTCLGELAGTCNAAGTGLVSATDCNATGQKCSAGACVTGPLFAMRATSTAARISVANTGFGLGGGAWTFEYWFRIHGLFVGGAGNADPTAGKMFDMNETYAAYAIRPTLSGRSIQAATYNNTTGPANIGIASTPFGAADTSWHHAAIVYDGAGTARLFIDGVLQGKQTGAAPTIQANSAMAIGKASGYANYYAAPVSLGGIRYSKVVRYSGDSSFTPASDWVVDANTIAQFLTKQGLGATLVDEAGGDNTGIIDTGWVVETP